MLASKLALVLLATLASAVAHPAESKAAESRERDSKVELVIYNKIEEERAPDFVVYGVKYVKFGDKYGEENEGYPVVELLRAKRGKRASRFFDVKQYFILYFGIRNKYVATFAAILSGGYRSGDRRNQLEVIALLRPGDGYAAIGRIEFNQRFDKKEGRCEEERR